MNAASLFSEMVESLQQYPDRLVLPAANRSKKKKHQPSPRHSYTRYIHISCSVFIFYCGNLFFYCILYSWANTRKKKRLLRRGHITLEIVFFFGGEKCFFCTYSGGIIKINNHIIRSIKTGMLFYGPLNSLPPGSNKVV